ncbi:P-loop containing nucleoside triphosphate hydrolase protein [Mycena sp. CBHHK59/15]|nr:P-loop containing nucleoside triphosphate hydrolase protein [Mycena sp. CBHHK59/15]
MATTTCPIATEAPLPVVYKFFPVDGENAAATVAADSDLPPRRSARRAVLSANASTPTLAIKRKREAEDEERDMSRGRQRRVKQEEQSHARADRDVARKRWLYANRALFEPLLPPQNAFFVNLTREMARDTTPPLPKHDFVVQPELVVGGEMKEYQLTGLSFLAHMYHNVGDFLLLKTYSHLPPRMGLGKTLQTLSLFAHIKETATGATTHLIVCPLSVLSSWEAECARWVPSMRVVRFHRSPDERERTKAIMRTDAADVVLTTYEALSPADVGWFKSRPWTCVVLDEGHRIKNADTDVARRVATVGGLWRVILTGTPIQNNLTELWGLFHWLYAPIFTPPTRERFTAAFDLKLGTYTLPFLDAVRTLLGAVQLRRTKAALSGAGELMCVPPREEWTVFVPLTEAQRFWTYRLLTQLDAVDLRDIFAGKEEEQLKKDEKVCDGRREVLQNLENHAKGGSANSTWVSVSHLFRSLLLTSSSPYLISDAEPEPYEIGEHVVASSSKLIVIDKILAEVLPKGERVLIFSHRMLDLLEDYMALRNITYARLDGSVSRARRAMDIRLFQRDDSSQKVFLISTKAGGLGINLTKASTCILCDSDWNPQNDLQAIARVHRIGQTKVVKVYRLICRASVEDQMLLMAVLRRGSSALEHSDDGMDLAHFRTASLAEILAVSRAREDVHDARVKHELQIKVEDGAALLRSAEEEERELLSGVAKVRCRLFEGQMVKRAESTKDIAKEWRTLQKRARVDRTVTVNGMTFIADDSSVGPKVTSVKKARKVCFESEDYCIGCRDGGELVMCNHCPRVFHAECHPTLSPKEVKALPLGNCGQHSCCQCSRSTAAAGGLLLRCQTCSQAFCSDCVSWDSIKVIGETIPEFVLLNYAKKDSAYFIRCADCCELGKVDPQWLARWEFEIAQSQRRVDLM